MAYLDSPSVVVHGKLGCFETATGRQYAFRARRCVGIYSRSRSRADNEGMRTLDLLAVVDPDLLPHKTKLHLATSNGVDDPLDVYRAGRFEAWQAQQARKNFEREFVVALIATGTPHQWMFAGAYRSVGCKPNDGGFVYDLELRATSAEFSGRLVSRFERPGRQAYLNAEGWIDAITVEEITRERVSLDEFPGFKTVNISKTELDAIVSSGMPSWKGALAGVGGVYLITDDETGRLYVGSATGEGGFWQRWETYASNGHGDNKHLRSLCAEAPDRHARFRYSILELADIATSPNEVLKREAHWKMVLGSRAFGLNAN